MRSESPDCPTQHKNPLLLTTISFAIVPTQHHDKASHRLWCQPQLKMEAPHDDPSHLDWSRWDDNYSEEDWSPVNLEGQATLTNSTVLSSFQNDAAPLEEFPVTPNLTLNDFGLDLGYMEPLDYIANTMNAPELVPSFMAEVVSPTSSGDVSTPTSGASSGASTGESTFTGSSLASNTPCHSPDVFLPQSPQACYINQPHNPTIDISQLFTITYTREGAIPYQYHAPTMPEAQERSSSQTTPATTDEADQMQKKPPGTRAYVPPCLTHPIS